MPPKQRGLSPQGEGAVVIPGHFIGKEAEDGAQLRVTSVFLDDLPVPPKSLLGELKIVLSVRVVCFAFALGDFWRLPGRKRRCCLSDQKEEETPLHPASRSRSRQATQQASPRSGSEAVESTRRAWTQPHRCPPSACFQANWTGVWPAMPPQVGLPTVRTAFRSGSLRLTQSVCQTWGGAPLTLAVSTPSGPALPHHAPLYSLLPRLWEAWSLGTISRDPGLPVPRCQRALSAVTEPVPGGRAGSLVRWGEGEF